MKPVELRTTRLVLDQPRLDDADLIAQYCADPLFENYMTTPWPYQRRHAVGFIEEYVPAGWSGDAEFTWAVRLADVDGPASFLGVIGFRVARGDLGYWLGAPHRGRGFMPEAATAVVDWLFEQGHDEIEWECVVGNLASSAVARKVGFTFTGQRASDIPDRRGAAQACWSGVLGSTDSRSQKPGWPEAG